MGGTRPTAQRGLNGKGGGGRSAASLPTHLVPPCDGEAGPPLLSRPSAPSPLSGQGDARLPTAAVLPPTPLAPTLLWGPGFWGLIPKPSCSRYLRAAHGRGGGETVVGVAWRGEQRLPGSCQQTGPPGAAAAGPPRGGGGGGSSSSSRVKQRRSGARARARPGASPAQRQLAVGVSHLDAAPPLFGGGHASMALKLCKGREVTFWRGRGGGPGPQQPWGRADRRPRARASSTPDHPRG